MYSTFSKVSGSLNFRAVHKIIKGKRFEIMSESSNKGQFILFFVLKFTCLNMNFRARLKISI